MSIFENSFLANLFWTFQRELNWFLALESGQAMLAATLAAIAASFLAWASSFAIGRVIALAKLEELGDGTSYNRVQGRAQRYGPYLLLLPWLPFMAILPMILGVFRSSPVTVLSLALAGRCLYYTAYLIL